MSDELLKGINTDKSHPKAGSHKPNLKISEEEKNLVIELDVSDHAQQPEHHTTWVTLEADNTPIAFKRIEPKYTEGKYKFRIAKEEIENKVTAKAKCNLHGTWKTVKEI